MKLRFIAYIALLCGGVSSLTTAARVAPPPLPPLAEAERQQLRNTYYQEAGIAFFNNGDQFAVYGKAKGAIHVFDCKDMSRPAIIRSSRNVRLTSMSLSDQHIVACGGKDSACRVFDLRTLTEEIHPIRRDGKLKVIAITGDAKHCAIGGDDGLVQLTDIAFKGKMVTLLKSANTITAMTFSHDGKLLAIGSEDGSLTIVQTLTGMTLFSRQCHQEEITNVAFSPNDKKLAAGSFDCTVSVWDTDTWRRELLMREHSKIVTSIAFSKDGKRFASTSLDGTIILFDQSFKRKLVFYATSGSFLGIAFHPSKPIIASIGIRIQFWDTVTGKETVPRNF